MSSSPTASALSNHKLSVDLATNDQQEKIMDQDKEPCFRKCSTRQGRNLVICIDGTSNKFGQNNTHIVELYSKLVKDKNQLTYYNSGIGTYASPSWRSWSYYKQALENKIDLAIAWTFERIVNSAYKWLAENYSEGDRIFLFGFSRGAYQVRALAGMIEKVGLIQKGNEDQIPFAWEIYSDPKSYQLSRPRSALSAAKEKLSQKKPELESESLVDRFKHSFSRKVQIHFVGVFDTVSSVGLIRGETLPLTNDTRHICFFRHALALDERRVKFLPEYACGGVCQPGNVDQLDPEDNAIPQNQRVKEIWFAGTHSDIGGGNAPNVSLDRSGPPLLWISYEGIAAGLLMDQKPVEWKSERLGEVNESFTWKYWPFEILPIKRQSYKGKYKDTRLPHLGKGRQIQPGQKVHASVVFSGEKYKPKAVFPRGSLKWEALMKSDNLEVTEGPESNGTSSWLEMDDFNESDARAVIDNLENSSVQPLISVYRLKMLAWSAKGCLAISKVDDAPERLFRLLSQPHIFGSLQFQIDIVDALVRFVPEYEITCLDEDESTKTIVRLLENCASHECVRRFIIRFYKGDAYKAFVLLGFYKELADALAARKEITGEFFIDQLRARLPQEDSPGVTDGRIELLGRIGDLLEQIADLDIQRVAFYALRTILLHSISTFLGTKANSSAETAAFKVIDVMLNILTRTSWVVRHSVVELMVDLLELDDFRDKFLTQRFIDPIVSLLSNSKPEIRCVAFALVAEMRLYPAGKLLAQQKAKSGGDSPMALMAANTDLALGKAFEILSHGDMLYLSTDDKGHVDDEISAHEIIQHMNQTLHSEDRSTRLSSLMTIFASLNFDDVGRNLLDKGLIEYLFNMLQGSDESIRQSVVDTLAGLARYRKFREELSKADHYNLGYLCNRLRTDNVDARRSLLKAISALANFGDLRQILLHTNLVEYLCQIVQVDDKDASQSTIPVLIEMAKFDDVRRELLERDVVDSLVRRLPHASESVRPLLWKLAISLAKCDKLRPRFLQAELVDCLIRLARGPRTDAWISSVEALSKLSDFGDIRSALLEKGFIEILVDKLRDAEVPVWRSFGFVTYSALNPVQKVQHEVAKARGPAIRALCTLSRHADIRKCLLNTSIVYDLCKMLRDRDDDVRNASAEAFISLAKHADIRSRVLDGKTVILLVNIMGKDEEQFARISAAEVIAALAEIDNFRTKVLSTDIVNDFPKLLQDQGQTCKSIIDTLMALAKFDDVQTKLLEAGVIHDLFLLYFQTTIDLRKSFLEAVITLTMIHELHNRVFAPNTVDLLLRRMRDPSEDVRRASADAIVELAQFGNVRTQLLAVRDIAYITNMLRVGDDTEKELSLKTINALAKYGDVHHTFAASVVDDLFNLFRGTNWVIWLLSIGAIISLTDPAHVSLSASLRAQLNYEIWHNTSIAEFDLAFKCIMEMSRTEELRSRLLQGGAVKHFADLFKQPQVRILAVQAVATLANYDDAGKQIHEVDVVDRLVETIRLAEDFDEKMAITESLKKVAESPNVNDTLLKAKCIGNLLEFNKAHNLSTEIIFQIAILDKDRCIQHYMPAKEAIAFFLQKFTDDDPFQRRLSINLIGKLAAYETFRNALAEMKIVGKVAEKYKGDDVRVRRAAIEAMALLAEYANLNDNSPRNVIRLLIDLLRDDDETIRQSCIKCISKSPPYKHCQTDFKDAGLPKFMLELLQDETRETRVGSLQAISELSKFADFRELLSKTDFVTYMVGILRDHDWTERYHLLCAVKELIKDDELRNKFFKSSFISSFIITLELFYSEPSPLDIPKDLPLVLSQCFSRLSEDSKINKKMKRAGLTESLREKVSVAVAAKAPDARS